MSFRHYRGRRVWMFGGLVGAVWLSSSGYEPRAAANPTLTKAPASPVASSNHDGSSLKAQPPPAPPWSHAAAVDAASCLAGLRAAGMKFVAHPVRSAPDRKGCGMPQAVTITRGATGVLYSPPLTIDCSLARHLPDIESMLEQEAQRHLASSLRKIEHLGGYACRPSTGIWTRRLSGKAAVPSDHAFGLALDLRAFVPKKGRTVTVSKDHGTDSVRGAFLDAIVHGLRKHDGISQVIGPWHDPSHRDHLHVGAGPRWGWWLESS